MGFLLPAIIAHGDEPERLGLYVEPRGRQVYRNPNAVLDGPKRVSFAGMKNPGLARR